MERALVVQGGIPLRGELRVNPAKNSALKIMVASLLTPEPVTLTEVPRLRDVDVMLELLSHLGSRYAWEGHTLHLHTPEIKNTEAPRELVDKMRASFIVMGALLGPGGRGHRADARRLSVWPPSGGPAPQSPSPAWGPKSRKKTVSSTLSKPASPRGGWFSICPP